MTTILPTLELKYNKEKTSSSTKTNTNNNNIIIKPTSDNIIDCPSEIPPEISTNAIVKKSDTPQNISEFKEALIVVLVSYFKNNVVLLNNLIELSDKIITKKDDLRLLISLLLSVPISDVGIEVEEITQKGCCGTIRKRIPRYRKVKDIIINKKQSFIVSYNQYYIQMNIKFNISLEYVLL
jgi:hypothetical protein